MRFVLLAALGWVALGCASTATHDTAPPVVRHEAPGLPDGWQEVGVAGVRIGLPQGYAVVDLTQANLDEAMKEFSIPGKEGAELIRQAKAAASQGLVKFIAFGPMTDGFRENVNLNVVPAAGATLEQVREQGTQALASVARGVEGKVLSDPARVEIASEMTAQGPAGPFTYRTLGLQLLHNGQLYTLTFSFPVSRESENRTLANDVLATLRFD